MLHTDNIANNNNNRGTATSREVLYLIHAADITFVLLALPPHSLTCTAGTTTTLSHLHCWHYHHTLSPVMLALPPHSLTCTAGTTTTLSHLYCWHYHHTLSPVLLEHSSEMLLARSVFWHKFILIPCGDIISQHFNVAVNIGHL